MRFGVIGSLADSRVTLFHYLPLILTRDAGCPNRWGRSKVLSLAAPAVLRGEGVALVYGPDADSVLRFIGPDKTPDPNLVVLVANAVEPEHALFTALQGQQNASISLHVVSPTSVLLCDRSTGPFKVKDQSKVAKDPSYVGPSCKPMASAAHVPTPKPVKAKKAKPTSEGTPSSEQ